MPTYSDVLPADSQADKFLGVYADVAGDGQFLALRGALVKPVQDGYTAALAVADDNVFTSIGSPADPAAASHNHSASVIAALKLIGREAAKASTVLGATDDGSLITNTSGTIAGRMRGISAALGNVQQVAGSGVNTSLMQRVAYIAQLLEAQRMTTAGGVVSYWGSAGIDNGVPAGLREATALRRSANGTVDDSNTVQSAADFWYGDLVGMSYFLPVGGFARALLTIENTTKVPMAVTLRGVRWSSGAYFSFGEPAVPPMAPPVSLADSLLLGEQARTFGGAVGAAADYQHVELLDAGWDYIELRIEADNPAGGGINIWVSRR